MIKYNGEPPIKYVVLHHTAVSRAVQPLQLNSVNEYHRTKDWGGFIQKTPSMLGWYVGYNVFCEATGARTQTRFAGEETIANVGHNCDVEARCDAISYCMAGDFSKEKPTALQVADFVDFVKEVRETYPDVKVVQHKDLQPDRTCACLDASEIEAWFTVTGSTTAQLQEENAKLRALNAQLIAMVTQLVALVSKK